MKLLSLCTAIVLIAASCQADLSDEAPRQKAYASLQDFYNNNKVPTQKVAVNSNNTISFQGAKGSRFTFPANAFVTQSGQPVTGDLSLEIREILKPVDMILSNMPTMSDDKPLESGGQFYIRATKNSEELKLAPGKLVQVNVRDNSSAMAGMQVFNGVDTAAGVVSWQLNTSPVNRVERDTIIGYKLFASDINWLNIDKFINQPLVKYTVNMGNCPDMSEAVAFVHLTGRNSVLSIPRKIDKFYSENLIATPVTIVAICIKDRKLYYAMSTVFIQDGGSTTLNFMETTEQALKDRLRTLK